MTVSRFSLAAIAVAAVVGLGGTADARDQIKIVGSSTVFPYTQAVAEEFANKTGKRAPVVESTGTGGGMKIFCAGVGEGHPDFTGASRAMKKSEYETCQANGVKDVSELLVGYDGLSFAVSKKGKAFDVTRRDLWLALAAEVPQSGKLVKNPFKKWSQINKAYPDVAIQVFGPPPTSGTRDAWVELVMEIGCEKFAEVEELSKDKKKEVCSRMRQDGPFIEAGENDNLIVQRLESDPSAYGIFGYSFVYENQDKIQALSIAGVTPSFETIADKSYVVSRPLFLYSKNAHRSVIPGMKEFIDEYASEAARGPDGYLHERGLVAAPDNQRKPSADRFIKGANMSAPTS